MERNEFERMVVKIRKHMYDTAFGVCADSDLAEDATQNALIKLWHMRDQLDSVTFIDSFSDRVVKNCCIDLLRQNSRRRTTGLSECEELVNNEPSAIDKMDADDFDRFTDSLLRKLPERQRAILTMKHIDGLETSEISSITGISEGNIRVLLSRSRHRIKNLFDERRKGLWE